MKQMTVEEFQANIDSEIDNIGETKVIHLYEDGKAKYVVIDIDMWQDMKKQLTDTE